MTGNDGERRGNASVRDGNTGVGGHGYRAGDARNYLEVNAIFAQSKSLLAAASENKRVAAFETHDDFSSAPFLDEQIINLGLRERVTARSFPNVNFFSVRRPAQNFFLSQPVVNHNVRRLKNFARLDRQKSGVAWSGANQIYQFHHFQIHNKNRIISAKGADTMKNFAKKVSPMYLAIFLPLTAASFAIGGATPSWIIVTTFGVGCIAWRWTHS